MGRAPQLPIQPNLLDRVITYVDPERGRARLLSRIRLFSAGGYTGARTDRAALQEWDPRNDSADSASVPDLSRLRSRSRDLVRNQPLAEAAVAVTVANVVGQGLYPIPAPDADYLGLTPAQAEAWAEQAERLWWTWAGSAGCDVARRLDHAGQQRLVCRSELESGDVLAIRRFVPRAGDPFALRIQLVEADRISTPDEKLSENSIVEGVELDSDGATLGWFVQDQHPGDYLTVPGERRWKRVTAVGRSTKDPNAVLLYSQLRPGQTRGVPFLAAAIERLKQMDRAVNAELMAQVVSGMIVYSVETELGDVVTRMASQTVGEIETDEAEGQLQIDYGAILAPAKGEQIKMHSPNRPGTTFEPFQLHVAREIGACTGIPAGVLLHWFSKAYSASRGEWMLAWKHWAVRRDHIAYGFSATAYGWLISEAVARGYLNAPGFYDDPLARAAWLGCEWRGAPPGQLDPLKEMQAIEKRRQLQISTLSQDTAEVTGGDWRANIRQLKAEKQALTAAGVAPAALPAAPGAPAEDPEEEDADE